MEQEMKIAELATFWGVSVPTTWNRIRKEGLSTVTKKNENNKEITYVTISDEILKSYVINANNNVNKDLNNGFYEETLSNNNINKNVNEVIDAEYSFKTPTITDSVLTLNNNYDERLSTVTERYENRLERLQEELITYKSQMLYLEQKDKDVTSREGFLTNEINELKSNYNRSKLYNKVLLSVMIVLLIIITGFITYHIGIKKVNNIPSSISGSIMDFVSE